MFCALKEVHFRLGKNIDQFFYYVLIDWLTFRIVLRTPEDEKDQWINRRPKQNSYIFSRYRTVEPAKLADQNV